MATIIDDLEARCAEALRENLQNADMEFGREPVAGICHWYKEYVASGSFPYIDNVALNISERFSIDETLLRQLKHEVYLASKQVHKDKDMMRASSMMSQGFIRATTQDMVEGKLYILRRYVSGIFGEQLTPETKVRCKKVGADGRYLLMPPRHTRTGYVVGYDNELWVKEVA